MKIGLTGLMFLVFLTLKLCGVIAWSWWWITAPLWIPVGIAAVMGLVMAVIAIVAYKQAQ